MQKYSGVLLAIILGLIASGLVACEIATWRECRTTNSWFYCVRVLNK